MSDCNDEIEDCGCVGNGTPVMPPSECSTGNCADEVLCTGVIPVACVQYIGEAKTCGTDIVYAEGDTIGVIEGKIVDYFCNQVGILQDNIDNIDLSPYALVSSISAVGFSNDFNDLDNIPAVLLTPDELAAVNGANTPSALNVFATINDLPIDTNFANTNLTFTGNRTHDLAGNSLTLNNGNRYIFRNQTFDTFLDINGNNKTAVLYGEDGVNYAQLLVNGFFGGASLSATVDVELNAGRDVNIFSSLGKLKILQNGTVKVISPNASSLTTAFSVRDENDLDFLHKTLGNGEFQNKRADGYLFDWLDFGNGFPAFTLEAPNGGQLEQRFRWNGQNKAFFSLRNTGDFFNINTKENVILEGRHIVDFISNSVHFQKNTSGEWFFDNDTLGLSTPESGVRLKLIASIGQTALKTVGKVNFNTIPLTNAGLSSGDLYFDTAANILANGDLVCGRKV